jgi:hypothetical protein
VPTEAAVAAASSSMQPLVLAQPVAAKPTSCVDPKLLRDHAVLNALCHCLQDLLQGNTNRSIPPDAIVAAVRRMAPALNNTTDTSLKQAVSHVCQKIIEWAHGQIKLDQDVHVHLLYSNERDRRSDGKVAGIVASRDGFFYLLRFALTTVHAMAFDSPKFLEKWRPSRSSKARAASVARGLGVKCGSARTKPTKSAQSEGTEESGEHGP